MRKAHRLLRWALLGILVTPAVASAQSAGATARIPRLDASAALGWFSANEGEVVPSDNWCNRSLTSSVSFSYYWTEHLKTEIDTGLTTQAELNEYQSLHRPSPTVLCWSCFRSLSGVGMQHTHSRTIRGVRRRCPGRSASRD